MFGYNECMTKRKQIKIHLSYELLDKLQDHYRKQVWWETYNNLFDKLNRELSPFLSGQLGSKVKQGIKND
jgi:hypothetical protein